MSLSFALALATQSIIGAAVAWVVADYLLERLGFDARVSERIGAPERALAAFVGFCLLAVTLMVVHIVTGGAIFGTRLPVPIVAVTILWLGRTRLRRPRVPRAVLALGAVLAALFVLPVVLGGPGARVGDPSWHLGWTEQLLAGDPVPTGPAAGVGANAYPWGFHALLATLVRLVPGSEPLVALETVHLMIVAGLSLAAACLARVVVPRAGLAAASAAALLGGLGWLLVPDAQLQATPHEAISADLVVTSPNAVFELLPPALPREVGLVLLGATALMVSLALVKRDRASAVVTGALVGCVGLFSVPMFVGAVLWVVAGWLVAWRGISGLLWMIGAAAVVFALWAGPVASAAVQYGGLVDVTPRLGREWGLLPAVGAWGLLAPAAVLGLVGTVRKSEMKDAGARLLLGFATACGVLLALALARAEFGWSLWSHETVLHQGRVWPQVHLLGAAFAGIAFWSLTTSRAVRTTIVGVVLALGAPSVVRSSIDMGAMLITNREGFSYDSSNLEPDSFVRAAARHLTPDDVLAVPPAHGPLGFLLFQFSGVRLSDYDDPRLESNDLRIRYRDLAAIWESRRAANAFNPDYIALPLDAGKPSTHALATGLYDGRLWVLVGARNPAAPPDGDDERSLGFG